MASDPDCGKTVRLERTKPTVHGGTIHYLSSRERCAIFEAALNLHVGIGKRGPSITEHSHG